MPDGITRSRSIASANSRFSSALTRRFLELDFVNFDFVVDQEVGEVVEADAAFEARLHLLHVVFEAAQTRDFPVVDEVAVAPDPCLGADPDRTGFNHAAADFRPLREFDDLQDLRFADRFLALFRLEFAGERIGDVLEQLVDDAVQADFDLLLLRQLVHARIDPDVEADHD